MIGIIKFSSFEVDISLTTFSAARALLYVCEVNFGIIQVFIVTFVNFLFFTNYETHQMVQIFL